MVGLGMVYQALGDHAKAQQCLSAGLAFAEDNGSERGQAAILHQLGRLDVVRGDHAAAIARYDRAFEAVQRVDDREGMCWTHRHLGEAHRMLGRHDQALVHLQQGHWLAQQVGSESAQVSILFEIGLVYRDRGEFAAASAYCERALIVIDTMPIADLAVTTQVCIALAEINHGRCDLNTATRYAQRAIALSQQNFDVAAEAQAQDRMGDIRLTDAELGDAVSSWRSAIDLYERVGLTSRTVIVRTKIDAVIVEAHSR